MSVRWYGKRQKELGDNNKQQFPYRPLLTISHFVKDGPKIEHMEVLTYFNGFIHYARLKKNILIHIIP